MPQWLDQLAPYLALAALVLAAIAFAWSYAQRRLTRALQEQYRQLTAGTAGGSLEEVLSAHLDNVRAATEQAAQARQIAQQAQRDGHSHLQHLSLLRYNPFSHTGGDQSFLLVLADADGNGAVINSLHARDGTRVYAKPLAAWESVYSLTDEEREAIARARGPVSAPDGNGKV